MAFISELKKDFQRLVVKNNLTHGYIFFGFGRRSPALRGEGDADDKFLFASSLANFLENKKWEISSRVLNDARILDAQEEGGIDLVRAASQFLWQKPAVSQKRTLIINRADNLTLPAQNAILKISEEPPPHALIILLVKNPEVFLPAVQSRFQKIFVCGQRDANPPAGGQISKFLKAGIAQRKEIIKEILEEEAGLEDFVAGLIAELRKDKTKNWQTLKELLHRWTMINQFNVNKKLQLEAALLELK